VANPQDEDNQPFILDLVDDTPITNSDSVETVASLKLDDAPWARIDLQGLGCCDNPNLHFPGQLAQLSFGGGSECDLIPNARHVGLNPRRCRPVNR